MVVIIMHYTLLFVGWKNHRKESRSIAQARSNVPKLGFGNNSVGK